jgi:multidrug efflux system outer membrane protein
MHCEFRTVKPESGPSRGAALTVVPLSCALAVLCSCAVGPNYKRPAVDAPAAYRRAATDTNTQPGANSFADLGWWETFKDPQLNFYLAEALTNSWDVKIAAARVLQAEANLRITRSQFMPSISAEAMCSRAVRRKGGQCPSRPA